MTTQQPLSLRLADELETSATFEMPLTWLPKELNDAAAELRRLHAKNEVLREALRKAVNRQGFSNEELISARAALAQGEKT
jgi:hypothetical protein